MSGKEEVLQAKKVLYLAYLNLDNETMNGLSEKETNLMYELSQDAEIQAILEKARLKGERA